MNSNVSIALLAALAIAGNSGAHAATNLVANGSFEQGAGGIGSFTGWQTTLGDAATFVDSSGQTGKLAGQASDGLWSAYFGSTAASGGATLSQVLATVANQSYLLSFDLANDNGGAAASNAFSASVGGATLLAAANLPAQNYVQRQFSFVAAGTATTLTFSAFNDSGYLQLDNVNVSAVPEPSGALLALAGLATVGLWRGRQKHL